MLRIRLYLFVVWTYLLISVVYAGQKPGESVIVSKEKSPSGSRWIYFNADYHNIDLESLFDNQRSVLGLSENDQMTLMSTETDQNGFRHNRFQQTYKGLQVKGATFIFHTKNNTVQKSNGKIIKGLVLNTTPSLSEEDALKLALDHVNANVYMWEVPKMEEMIKGEQDDEKVTFFPQAELAIAAKNYEMSSNNFHLVYRFDIYAQYPMGRYYVDIDAHTGEVINTLNRIHTDNADGTGLSLYNGTVNIVVDKFSRVFYRLRKNNGFPAGVFEIRTYDMENGSNYGNADDFVIAGLPNFTSENARAGVSAHWSADVTSDYYLNEHGRASFDGFGARINSYVHTELTGLGYSDNNNAFWDGSRLVYGDGDGTIFNPLVSLDVVGHEFTHAVTNHSADLVYQGESGALNESFSDIFGTAIEFYVEGSGADWWIGEDCTINLPCNNVAFLRSLQNPKAACQPDTYGGTNWAPTGSTASDNGGVHTNSGVQNYWFFLLSQGGSGVNDNLESFYVDGIGINKAEDIAYRNLTRYLTSSDGYVDAGKGAREAATDLYGILSNEVAQVANAWYAVGVTDVGDLTIDQSQMINTEISYSVTDSITAGPYTVNTSGKVVFFAGNSIKLDPGFMATSGSNFRASILGDNTTSYNSGSSPLRPIVTPAKKSNALSKISGNNDHVDPSIQEVIEPVPTEFSLSKNYPNPFNPSTTIRYALPTDSHVSLKIYNMLGQLVITLVDDKQTSGFKEVVWDGRNKAGLMVTSGMYIYRIVAGNFVKTQKMTFVK
jgi:Zn-dependent metalloprotease